MDLTTFHETVLCGLEQLKLETLRPHVNYVDLTTFHETVLCGLKQLKLETF